MSQTLRASIARLGPGDLARMVTDARTEETRLYLAKHPHWHLYYEAAEVYREALREQIGHGKDGAEEADDGSR